MAPRLSPASYVLFPSEPAQKTDLIFAGVFATVVCRALRCADFRRNVHQLGSTRGHMRSAAFLNRQKTIPQTPRNPSAEQDWLRPLVLSCPFPFRLFLSMIAAAFWT